MWTKIVTIMFQYDFFLDTKSGLCSLGVFRFALGFLACSYTFFRSTAVYRHKNVCYVCSVCCAYWELILGTRTHILLHIGVVAYCRSVLESLAFHSHSVSLRQYASMSRGFYSPPKVFLLIFP